jgi:hypothetical protein
MNYGNDTDDIALVSHLEGGVRYCSSSRLVNCYIYPPIKEGRGGSDRMVVGITAIYAISVYHH